MSSSELFGALSEAEREIAMERAQQITRGRLQHLTPSQREVVLDLVKNEALQRQLEAETKKFRRLTDRIGRMKPAIDSLVKLRESNRKVRERVDEYVNSLEPKRATSLQDYLASRGVEPEADSLPDATTDTESLIEGETNRLDRPQPRTPRIQAFKAFCEKCGSEFEGGRVRGDPRRFCSRRCRAAAWRDANRDGGNRDTE